MKKLFIIPTLITALALGGCSGDPKPYVTQESTTSLTTDSLVRYGGPLALGAGGFYAGKAIGGSTSTGILGAVAGLAVGVGYDVFSDSKRADAYKIGVKDGANEARAEQSLDQWKREAVYNAPGGPSSALQPEYRDVYVKSRTINGVLYPGGYQEVEAYP